MHKKQDANPFGVVTSIIITLQARENNARASLLYYFLVFCVQSFLLSHQLALPACAVLLACFQMVVPARSRTTKTPPKPPHHHLLCSWGYSI